MNGIFIDFKEEVSRALDRIKPDIKRTVLEFSPSLSEISGAKVYLKWENDQRTGSFKIRGALNKVRTLSPEERRKGIVSASTGNHGLGISLASKLGGVKLTLVLPKNITREKRSRLEKSGAEIIEYGETCDKAELWARRMALDTGRVFVSPYNDEQIICGQGTIGLEIFEDCPDAQAVLVAVGGGGLCAGIAGYLRSRSQDMRIFGVEPENSAVMAASLRAGRIVEIKEGETIADAVAGGIEPGAITFPLCQELLEGIVTADEVLIKRAMRLIYDHHQKKVEGAGALPLAGLLAQGGLFQKKKVVLVVSGGNISAQTFGEAAAGR
jgi:threonine dehydratase